MAIGSASGRDRRAPPSQPVPWESNTATFTTTALFVTDAVAILFGSSAVLFSRYLVFGPVPVPQFSFWTSIVVWFAVRWMAKLYAPFGLQPPEKLQRSFASTGVVSACRVSARPLRSATREAIRPARSLSVSLV